MPPPKIIGKESIAQYKGATDRSSEGVCISLSLTRSLALSLPLPPSLALSLSPSLSFSLSLCISPSRRAHSACADVAVRAGVCRCCPLSLPSFHVITIIILVGSCVGKGHLVREIDALDGLCGLSVDDGGIQFRVRRRTLHTVHAVHAEHRVAAQACPTG